MPIRNPFIQMANQHKKLLWVGIVVAAALAVAILTIRQWLKFKIIMPPPHIIPVQTNRGDNIQNLLLRLDNQAQKKILVINSNEFWKNADIRTHSHVIYVMSSREKLPSACQALTLAEKQQLIFSSPKEFLHHSHDVFDVVLFESDFGQIEDKENLRSLLILLKHSLSSGGVLIFTLPGKLIMLNETKNLALIMHSLFRYCELNPGGFDNQTKLSFICYKA